MHTHAGEKERRKKGRGEGGRQEGKKGGREEGHADMLTHTPFSPLKEMMDQLPRHDCFLSWPSIARRELVLLLLST